MHLRNPMNLDYPKLRLFYVQGKGNLFSGIAVTDSVSGPEGSGAEHWCPFLMGYIIWLFDI